MPRQSVKSLAQMTPAELCTEADSLRSSLTNLAEQLHETYSQMHTLARRSQDLDSASIYISLANVGRRFSGMILQASRRSFSMEGRFLLAIQREAEEKELKAREAIQKKEAAKKKQRAEAERADPLEALFGVVKPKIEFDPTLINSEFIPNGDPSSDLDTLYGEELV